MPKAVKEPEKQLNEVKPATVELPLEDAEQLYELYRGIEAADSHFHTCQSVSFREHVKAVYKAPKIEAAFDALRMRLESTKEV